jgi:hypothetical protein
LLRLYAERNDVLNDDARQAIKVILDGIEEYKGYRDNIAHSVPYDIDKGIAHGFKYGTDLVQTLVTVDAYFRLKMLIAELRDVDMLYRLTDERGAYAVYPDEPDPVGRRRTRDVPLQTARLRDGQKRRLSFSPLPRFPDEGVSLREEPESTL